MMTDEQRALGFSKLLGPSARTLLLILVLLAFARVTWRLGERHLWWDESLSLQRAESSWGALLRGELPIRDGVVEVMSIDQHPLFLLPARRRAGAAGGQSMNLCCAGLLPPRPRCSSPPCGRWGGGCHRSTKESVGRAAAVDGLVGGGAGAGEPVLFALRPGGAALRAVGDAGRGEHVLFSCGRYPSPALPGEGWEPIRVTPAVKIHSPTKPTRRRPLPPAP